MLRNIKNNVPKRGKGKLLTIRSVLLALRVINYATFISTKPRLLILYTYIDPRENATITNTKLARGRESNWRGRGRETSYTSNHLYYTEDKCTTRHFQCYQRIFAQPFFRAQTSLINIRVRAHPTVNSFIKT